MRTILLLWASAALGQEEMYGDPLRDAVDAVHLLEPAYALAEAVFDWLEPSVLGREELDGGGYREQLGMAAYLRGESRRRSGFFRAAGTDLRFALTELTLSGANEGNRLRCRLSQLALAADEGNDLAALDGARTLLVDIRSTLGEGSSVEAETDALLSTLLLRSGDAEGALREGASGVQIGLQSLPERHSLIVQLRAKQAESLLERDPAAAARASALALGVPAIRSLSPAEDSQLLARIKPLRESRPRLQVLREVIGFPAPPAQRPALQRVERMHAARVLRKAWDRMSASPERSGALALYDAVDLEEQTYGGGGARANAALGGGFSAELRRYPESLDRMMMGTNPGAFWAKAEQLRQGTRDLLAPVPLVLGDTRPAFQPGEPLDALEVFLHDLKGVAPDPIGGIDSLSLALLVAQATLGSEVLASLGPRAYLGVAHEPISPSSILTDVSVDPNAASHALAAEAALRRLRGLVTVAGQQNPVDEQQLRLYYLQIVHAVPALQGLLSQAFEQGSTAPLYGALPYEASKETLRAGLAPGEAVVIWLPLEHTTQIFLITPDQARWVESNEGRVALARHIRALRGSVESAMQTMEEDRPVAGFPVAEAQALHGALFTGIEADLVGVKHLYAVQLGVTGGFPLSMLVRSGSTRAQPDWLIDHFALTRMPTIVNPAVLAGARSSPAATRPTFLAIGNPVLDSRAQSRLLPPWISLPAGLQKFPDDTEMKMRSIAAAFGPPHAAREILSGARATRHAVLARLGKSNDRVIFFLTHGLVGRDDIGEPALVLTPDNRSDDPAEGLLRSSDAARLNLEADLVILAACQTAPSGEDGAEGLAGLASSFIAAGAHGVVASYWPVLTDVAPSITQAMIVNMYERNQPAAFALQAAMRAQRDLNARDATLGTHPAFWASLDLIGLPTSRMPVEPRLHRSASLLPAVPPPRPAGREGAGDDEIPGTISDRRVRALLESAFLAEEQGDCADGAGRIRAVGGLATQIKSASQRAAIQEQVMKLILADRRCMALQN